MKDKTFKKSRFAFLHNLLRPVKADEINTITTDTSIFTEISLSGNNPNVAI